MITHSGLLLYSLFFFSLYQLKREFGLNFSLFGGADGFSKWFDTCCHPSCSNEVLLI